MDGLHLPEIGKLRERSGVCLGSVIKHTTACEGQQASAGRRPEKGCREKQRTLDGDISSRKKRGSEQKSNSKKSSSSSGKSIRLEVKAQNTRRRNETIGLPKINTNIEEDAFINIKTQEGAKKPRRTKQGNANGGTISYVYSKSLQDENTMAFLRNSRDFEKDLSINTDYKKRDKRSSSFDKKPYGLPSLKVSEVLNERLLDLDDFSEGSLSETESLLNAWEVIDDDVSNDTYASTDSLNGQ